MTRPLYPGFTDADLRGVDNAAVAPERVLLVVDLWAEDAANDHDDLHAHHRHPWCESCETQGLEAEIRSLPDDQVDEFFDNIARIIRRRAVRHHLLHGGRRPTEAPPEPPRPFDAGFLTDMLARPDGPPMRCEGLIPADGGTLLVAARKTGKTSLELNIARSLITGEPLLDRFETRPVDGVVALLNYEVSGDTLKRWADEAGVPDDRLFLVNLRGRPNPLRDDAERARLARLLRNVGTEALIVDPFGRAFTGSNQNDPGEVGAWLAQGLDVFARDEIGATDIVLAAHAGWNGERTRGSSALEDWADVIVTMTRDAEDDTKRYLKAEGRDVLLDEDRLDYDPATRQLSLTGAGSRRKNRDDRKIADLAVLVVRAARTQPGAGVADLERAIKAMDDAPTFRNGEISKAAHYAREHGQLHIHSDGPGRRTKHFAIDIPATPPNPSRTHPRDDPPTPPTPPYRGGVGGGSGPDTDSSPTLNLRQERA